MKGFVKRVKSLFLGEKNGKEIGKMYCIAVKDVKKIKQNITESNLFLKI